MKLVYAGDAINPYPPCFELENDDIKEAIPVGITRNRMEKQNEKY